MSWKEKRDELVELIKKVSDMYGGDDPSWLKSYTQEVIGKNRYNLESAICDFKMELFKHHYQVKNGELVYATEKAIINNTR